MENSTWVSSHISLVSHMALSICRTHKRTVITSWWTNPLQPCRTLNPTKVHNYGLLDICLSSSMTEVLTFFFFILYLSRHKAGINKAFVINVFEYWTIFSAHITVTQSDFDTLKTLKDCCGGGGTSILNYLLGWGAGFKSDTTHWSPCPDTEST